MEINSTTDVKCIRLGSQCTQVYRERYYSHLLWQVGLKIIKQIVKILYTILLFNRNYIQFISMYFLGTNNIKNVRRIKNVYILIFVCVFCLEVVFFSIFVYQSLCISIQISIQLGLVLLFGLLLFLQHHNVSIDFNA